MGAGEGESALQGWWWEFSRFFFKIPPPPPPPPPFVWLITSYKEHRGRLEYISYNDNSMN